MQMSPVDTGESGPELFDGRSCCDWLWWSIPVPHRSREEGISVHLFAGPRLSESVTPSSLSLSGNVILLWMYVLKLVSDLVA